VGVWTGMLAEATNNFTKRRAAHGQYNFPNKVIWVWKEQKFYKRRNVKRFEKAESKLERWIILRNHFLWEFKVRVEERFGISIRNKAPKSTILQNLSYLHLPHKTDPVPFNFQLCLNAYIITYNCGFYNYDLTKISCAAVSNTPCGVPKRNNLPYTYT